MPSFVRLCVAFGTFLSSAVVASPIIEKVPSVREVRARDLELGRRAFIAAHTIGTYDCASSFQDNTIFSGANLEVTCIDCHTTGTALVTTSDVTKNTTLLDDILHPIDAIADAFGIDLKVTLQDFVAYFDLELIAKTDISKTIQLLKIPTPLGVAISDDVSVGLVIYLDLDLDLSAQIDMTAGFSISFPDGAYIIVDPLTGNIVDRNFDSPGMGYLPATAKSGSATLTAALQVRVEVGSTVELGLIGYAFELGMYIDAIEYKATLSSRDACQLYVTEGLDINIGAYAEAVAEIDYTTFGVSPTAKTTIWTTALPSICSNPTTTSPSVSVKTAVLPNEPITLSSTSSSSTSIKTTVLPNQPITPSSASKSTTSTSSVFQASATATSSSPFSAQTAWSNSTSSAQLTTSTVYATDTITVMKCPATVTKCPANQKAAIEVVTSIRILYTTIYPVSQAMGTALPGRRPVETLVNRRSKPP
ncbi:hypothetical protein BGZ60DRAFT_528816 [Tricladium varicosporioides]|nr:hypothetical protein BGZ60DRAFT_528816 [Hymenoscyphus varicosporioides]